MRRLEDTYTSGTRFTIDGCATVLEIIEKPRAHAHARIHEYTYVVRTYEQNRKTMNNPLGYVTATLQSVI